MSESLTNIRYITLRHSITLNTRQMIVFAQPSLLNRMFEPTLLDRILRQFTHIHSTKLIDLRSDGVLLNERFFRKRELKRVIGRKGNIQTSLEVAQERVSFIC